MPDVDLSSCLAEWASRGPRYTSYPPATEFGPIAVDVVRDELAAIGREQAPVSLYVHVPFCRSLCWYCGCNVIATRDATRGMPYVDQLATEMTLIAPALRRAPVTELAIGGGSPNFLSPHGLRTLCTALDRYFAFVPGARRSIELDPRTTTSGQIETLAAARFTSLSIGVQDFAGPVQDAIHRHQSRAQTRWLVECARRAGFDDINVDLVYGLPLQSEASFAQTLDAIVALGPDRIALFGYAHLPSKLPHQRLVERAGRVLDSYERATLLLLAIDQLTRAGYLHLGLDHFARPGSRLAIAAQEQRMVRTFQGYVEHRADVILGLGVSAISSTPRVYWQNHAELPRWEADIVAGRLPIAHGCALDEDDRVRRAVIGRLMCDGTADLDELGCACALDLEAYFADELRRLEGLRDLAAYDRSAQTIRTTPLGKLLVRNVCMVFDRYQRVADRDPQFSSTI